MSSADPYHRNRNFALTTQKWHGSDHEENFNKNCADPHTRKKLEDLGWIGVDIVYKFNSNGFRDDNFDQQSAGIALGCSHTHGVGIHASDTWPKQLEKMLGQKVWNLGVGGSSLDTCYRLLDYWIEHLNVKFVVCAVPELLRYEFFDSPSWVSYMPLQIPILPGKEWFHDYHKHYIIHDRPGILNRQKNLQAMKYICNKHNVPFYYDLLTGFFDGAADARDLCHFGSNTNYKLAKKFANEINIQGKI